jgi:hypothetical protein
VAREYVRKVATELRKGTNAEWKDELRTFLQITTTAPQSPCCERIEHYVSEDWQSARRGAR